MNQELSEQSQEMFRLVIDNVEDFAVFTTDLEGRHLSWNRGVERLLGYAEEEWLGRHASIIFTPEDREQREPEREMETALREGRAKDQRWHLRRDGTRFWTNGLLMLLRDEAGRARGFAKILRDDTSGKRAEDELRRAHDELEQKVEERTRALQEMSGALLAEIDERRQSEGRVRELLRRVVDAQEIERRRIAQDLHDNLGQMLTAQRLNLQYLKERCGAQDEVCELVGRAQDIAVSIEREVDFIAWELRPAALDHLGLAAALDNFTREFSKHYRVPAEFHAAGLDGDRLMPEVETTLYRIAQEALNNVMKHAAATQVGVLLERHGPQVTLIVEDDGRGFEPSGAIEGERGMGLLSMRERAEQIGGTFGIESAPGAGTTLYVRVPLKNL